MPPSFGTDLGLEPAVGAQHVERQPAHGIGDVDVLVQRNEIDAIVAQGFGDLAWLQRVMEAPDATEQVASESLP